MASFAAIAITNISQSAELEADQKKAAIRSMAVHPIGTGLEFPMHDLRFNWVEDAIAFIHSASGIGLKQRKLQFSVI
jgi:hypothetical protein